MTAPEIVLEIARHGHTVAVDGDMLVVRPAMAEPLRERVRARKSEIVAYLREFGEPASGHTFAALGSVDPELARTRGVCIACGIPWPEHGEPPQATWRCVDDPNEVALIEARAIVAAAAASAR